MLTLGPRKLIRVPRKKANNLFKRFFLKIDIDLCYFSFQIMMTCVVFTFHDLRRNGGEIPWMRHVTGL